MNTLKAEKRNAKAKALRREGYVTGNLFGREIEGSIPVKMTQKTCICIWKETAFYTGSHSEKSAEDSISRWKSSWTKSIYK